MRFDSFCAIVAFAIIKFCVLLKAVTAETCENGCQIMEIGLSREAASEIVDAHNNYRRKICRGEVSDQPQGTNLLKMEYDNQLGAKARKVSLQCEMNHREINDDRFPFVGQNLYFEYSSSADRTQNWRAAIKAWFDEHHDYRYGQGFSMKTGHYTQVVWADSYAVGCDFIMYKDNSNPDYPYQKLYTCNYGPGGNFNNQEPYDVSGTGECEVK